MSEKAELKPCPFCGNPPKVDFCGDVYCDCSMDDGGVDSTKWNLRPIEDAQAMQIAELKKLVYELRWELAQSERKVDGGERETSAIDVFGMHKIPNLIGFPPGRIRIRMRYGDFIVIFVKTAHGIRKFYPKIDRDGNWIPAYEIAVNERRQND